MEDLQINNFGFNEYTLISSVDIEDDFYITFFLTDHRSFKVKHIKNI